MTEDGGLSDGGGATMPGGGEAEETFYFLPGRRDSGAAGMMESARALSRTVQRTPAGMTADSRCMTEEVRICC